MYTCMITRLTVCVHLRNFLLEGLFYDDLRSLQLKEQGLISPKPTSPICCNFE